MTIDEDNLIEKDLWDAARWRQTVFLVTPDLDSQPGIALQFEDATASIKIFENWREKFGGFADRRDRLRICFVTGRHPTHGEGFSTIISTDTAPPPGQPLPTKQSYIAAGMRWRFQSTDTKRQSFDWFRASHTRKKTFFIVPMPIVSGGECIPDVSRCIVKSRVYFRTFDEVARGGDGDIDALVLT